MTDTTTMGDELADGLRRLTATKLDWRDRLARRIVDLSVAIEEDYPGQKLSGRSLDALLDFLEASLSPDYPDLTATPVGDLCVEWRHPDGRHLIVEFLDSSEARYLVIRPNPRHPKGIDRLTGSTTADALETTIASIAHFTGIAA